jgi:hypothetical protein
LQDAFIDDDGLAVVYEISVRHRRVRGEPNYVTAEVLLMAHAARPIKGSPERSMLVVVSQIDARSRSSWLTGMLSNNETMFGGTDVLHEVRW